MKRIARMTKTTKTYGTVELAERAALQVGDGKDLNFTIAADTRANGKVRFYPVFHLAGDQFRFASTLAKLGFHVVGG
jgi:predicted alpha/beta hydrolase